MTYEVIYRMGGTNHCTWRKVLDKCTDRSEALQVVKYLKRQGYHAEVRTSKELESIGLPVGWEYGAVDWENDEVTITSYETVHIKRG